MLFHILGSNLMRAELSGGINAELALETAGPIAGRRPPSIPAMGHPEAIELKRLADLAFVRPNEEIVSIYL